MLFLKASLNCSNSGRLASSSSPKLNSFYFLFFFLFLFYFIFFYLINFILFLNFT